MKPERIMFILLTILATIIFAGLYLESYVGAGTISLDKIFVSPSINHAGGTDELGRDVGMRAVEGASISLRHASVSWTISSLTDYIFATPFLLSLIALLSILGPGLLNGYLVLTLFAWAAPARQARTITSGLKNAQYLKAAKSFGYNSSQVLGYVVIPQVFNPVLITSLATFPEIIALDTVLSFFGLGIRPPVPSLGKMLADGINYISVAWWMTIIPLFFLVLICVVFRFLINSLSKRLL